MSIMHKSSEVLTENVFSQMLYVVVVITFFSIGLKSALVDTTKRNSYHVNRTWTGKSYCTQSRDLYSNVLVNCRLENITQLGQLVPNPEIVYSL